MLVQNHSSVCVRDMKDAIQMAVYKNVFPGVLCIPKQQKQRTSLTCHLAWLKAYFFSRVAWCRIGIQRWHGLAGFSIKPDALAAQNTSRTPCKRVIFSTSQQHIPVVAHPSKYIGPSSHGFVHNKLQCQWSHETSAAARGKAWNFIPTPILGAHFRSELSSIVSFTVNI